MALRYAAGNRDPDHDTIAGFCIYLLERLSLQLAQIPGAASQIAILELAKLSRDREKVPANALKDGELCWQRACNIEAVLGVEVDQWILRKAADTEQYGIADRTSILRG